MRLCLFVLLAACAPSAEDSEPPVDTDPDTDTGTDTDPDTDPDTDTGLVGLELALSLVDYRDDAYADAEVWGVGVIWHDNDGLLNAAGCVAGFDGPCLDELPTEGVTVDLDPQRGPDLAQDVVDGGLAVGEYTFVPSAEPGWLEVVGAPWSLRDVGLAVGPPLHLYGGEHDVLFPPLVQLTSPDPLLPHTTAGEPLELSWLDPGQDTYVLVEGPGVAQLSNLGRATTWQLDPAAYPLPELADLRVRVMTVGQFDVDAAGNDVRVHTRSEQWLYVAVRDLADRDPAPLFEDCATADAGPVLDSGAWWGDASAAVDDIDLGEHNGCTGDWPTAGPDLMARVQVPAGQTLRVRYLHAPGDAVAYLLGTCSQPATCLAGADEGTAGQEELLTWTNTTGEPQTPTLVLDSFADERTPEAAVFVVDVVVGP